MSPRSTNYEADALTTTPSHQSTPLRRSKLSVASNLEYSDNDKVVGGKLEIAVYCVQTKSTLSINKN